MELDEATGAALLPTGASTMSPAMASMHAYPRYLYRKIRPCLGRRVWEIGVGHGTYTRWLRDDGASVLATDVDADCLAAVAAHFLGDSEVTAARVDLTDEQSVRDLRDFHADSIVCLNVLEHISDDVAALRWLRESVVGGARMGIVVPAHPTLFGRMDAEAGHFRRYTRVSLRSAFEKAGWHVERVAYFNLLGAIGWWYHNRWRKDAGLEDATVNHQMSAVDRWLPRVALLTDPLFGRLAGLSVLGIAENPGPGAS